MPTIYKIRDRLNQTSKFVESYPDAIIEQLEYQYKWQIVVMLENAYLEGVIDERDR